jgi:hypothetical protein
VCVLSGRAGVSVTSTPPSACSRTVTSSACVSTTQTGWWRCGALEICFLELTCVKTHVVVCCWHGGLCAVRTANLYSKKIKGRHWLRSKPQAPSFYLQYVLQLPLQST